VKKRRQVGGARYVRRPCKKCGHKFLVAFEAAYPLCNDCYLGPTTRFRGPPRHSANQHADRARSLVRHGESENVE
jgi:hypothetical protein